MSTDILEKIDNDMRNACEFSEKCQTKFPGSFTKVVLRQGQGFLRPYQESFCVLDIFYKAVNEDDKLLDNCESLQIPTGTNLELKLGSAETEVVRIVEKCIMTMRRGEESEFVLNLFAAVHLNTQKESSSLLLKVILHDFSETKPTWSLNSEEKHELALLHKEKGTDLFKNGKTEAAFCQYSIAISYLICIPECTSVIDNKLGYEAKLKKEKYNTLKCVCYLNLAACQMKVENYYSVIKNCTHALSLDSSNVKGLYRRAQANLKCGRFEEARFDLKRAMKIEPKNQTISALLELCK